MKYIFQASVFAAVLLLASCKPYQMDIPQGKTLTELQVSQVKVGMSKESVLQMLGAPLQGVSPYDTNSLDYVTTMQKNGGIINEKRFTVYFKNNVVQKIEQKDEIVNK
jgi:outer membrane protein assembly factor BamE